MGRLKVDEWLLVDKSNIVREVIEFLVVQPGIFGLKSIQIVVQPLFQTSISRIVVCLVGEHKQPIAGGFSAPASVRLLSGRGGFHNCSQTFLFATTSKNENRNRKAQGIFHFHGRVVMCEGNIGQKETQLLCGDHPAAPNPDMALSPTPAANGR